MLNPRAGAGRTTGVLCYTSPRPRVDLSRGSGDRMSATDEQLVAKIGAGDPAAFAALYDRHAAGVLGYLVKFLRDRTEADDVLQATFLQVWRSAARFDPTRGSTGGWIRMMARSRALDALRRRRRALLVTEGAEPEAPDRAAAGAEHDERAGRIREALAQLPESQRGALDLAFFGGFTHAQIAERLDVPLGTVKTWIRRGMDRMRSILDAGQEVSA